MEPFAARQAAERMDAAALKALTDLARSMEPGQSHNSRQRFADQDSRLHDLIAQGSGNRIIQDSLARLHTHLHIFRLRFHDDITTGAHAEHASLVAALDQRDGAAAEAAMRAHIEKSYERLAAFAQS
jgi:DNA-binding GntR family transcriptional regulator